MEKQVKPEHEEIESHRGNRIVEFYYRALKRWPIVTLIFSVPLMWLTALIPIGIFHPLLPSEYVDTAGLIFLTAWLFFALYIVIKFASGARKRGIF